MGSSTAAPVTIIVFDGLCNLCSGSVQFVLRHNRRADLKFAPAQSARGSELLARHGFDPQQLETFVVLVDGRALVRSAAALEIARHLDWPWRALRWLRVLPRGVRDPLYNFIARNRYRWFGRRAQCLAPSASDRARFL